MERLCTSTSSLQHGRRHSQASPPSAAGCCTRRRCPPAGSAAPPPRRQAAAGSKRVKPLRAASEAWAAESEVADSSAPAGLQAAKQRLLAAIAGTERGGEARALQRGLVEEAQVAVEALTSSSGGGSGGGFEGELDFGLLEGKWRLEYTTARDVLPLVAPQRLPAPLQVGRIYQRFTSLAEGRVQNLIEARLPAGLPLGLGEGSSLTLVVEAGYEVRTARSIALTFREAGFGDVVLGPGLQNLLASPILPRGWWNQQLLLAIQELALRVPLTSRLPGTSSNQQLPVGINYMLTYLDGDMLIGRAQGNGGTFIFTREVEEHGQGAEA